MTLTEAIARAKDGSVIAFPTGTFDPFKNTFTVTHITVMVMVLGFFRKRWIRETIFKADFIALHAIHHTKFKE
jgi:hypothetical protein